MEKHHKLRRPVGSSLHGCNICGKEGHQAALCAVGTVDWGNKWGKDAFWPDKPHVYEEPDYKAIALKAKEWAEQKRKRKLEGDANADGDGADGVKKEEGGDTPAPAPGAWQTFFDQFGRPYYYNAATNTTQWTAPPGVLPPGAVPPPMPPPGGPSAPAAGGAAPGPVPPASAPGEGAPDGGPAAADGDGEPPAAQAEGNGDAGAEGAEGDS